MEGSLRLRTRILSWGVNILGSTSPETKTLKLIKTSVVVPFVIALSWCWAFAQEPPSQPEKKHNPEFGAEMDFNSGYVWRGLLLNDGPVMHPSAWISKSGLTLLAWSSLPLTTTLETERLKASGLVLSYEMNWKKLSIEPSVETYFNRSQSNDASDTTEALLKFSHRVGPLNVFTTHAFDVVAYRGAYFGEAGLGYEGQLTKKAILTISVHSGWASSKFNDSYIGLPKRAVNLVGAEGSVSYYLKPYLYFRPHFEFSSIADGKLRRYLESSTINSFGLALGAEF